MGGSKGVEAHKADKIYKSKILVHNMDKTYLHFK